jgi:O-antigen ligase
VNAASHTQSSFPTIAIAFVFVPLILCVAVMAMPHGGWPLLLGLPILAFFLAVARPRFQSFLFLIFVLIAWFPEFSQTEWDVHTAQDSPSLYNFRPISAIAASVFDYLFAAIVVAWVLTYVLPGPRKLLKAPFARTMLAFFTIWVFNLLHGLFRGNETYYALREFRVGAYFVLTYLMVVTVCGERRAVRKFIKLSVVMAAVVGVYGILRYLMGIGKEFADVRLVYYDIADSMVLYIAMLLIASFAIEGMVKKGKALLTTTLILPMVFSFVFSYRRGAWVAFTVGLVFLILSYPHRAPLRRTAVRRVLVPASLIIVLIASVPTLRSNGLNFVARRVQSIFDVSEDTSNAFRILDAMNAFHAFTQHPIIGVGAGGRYSLEFTSEQPDMMTFMEEVNRTSHDGYLYVLFKTGIVGFLIYMLVFAKFLARWFQARKLVADPMERAVLLALGAIVTAFLMNNVTEPVSDTLRPAMLLAFVMGFGAVWMRGLNDRARSPVEQVVGQGNPQNT